jgi:hypothetical protein
MDELSELARGTDIRWNSPYVGTVEYAETKGMTALFYRDAQHNKKKSQDAGRPIFEDVTMVRIGPPGERLNVVIRPASRADVQRFPREWARFEQGQPQVPDGTPVEMLYPERPSIGKQLKASGVHTVEQLSELSSHAIDQIGMGCQTWVNYAQKYVEDSKKGVTSVKMRRELELRDQEINSLKHEIDLLKTALAGRDKEVGEVGSSAPARLTQATIDEMVANAVAKATGARPVLPRNGSAAIDTATAQINANAPSAEIARQKKSRRKSKSSASE